MKGTSLTPRQRNRVRKGLRLLARRYPTQRELGGAVAVSQQTISSVLAGQAMPGIRLALGVARGLGWSLEDLVDSKLPLEPPAPPAAAHPVALQIEAAA